MERLWVDLPDEAKASQNRSWACGGALLKVTREMLRELKCSGVKFTSVDNFGGEHFSARVECQDECEERNGYRMGLCYQCGQLEKRMRDIIRAQGAGR